MKNATIERNNQYTAKNQLKIDVGARGGGGL